jgi:predicted PurR-regulated permease PerM
MFDRLGKAKNSKAILTAVILVFAAILLYMLRVFIDAFLGAVILYVLFRPLMIHLCEKRKWKRGLAAVLILFLSFICVLLPVFSISYLIVSRLSLFFSDTSMVMQIVHDIDAKITATTGFSLLSAENIQAIQSQAAGYITQILSQSFSLLADVAILYFFLYYLLTNYGRWSSMIKEFLPLSHDKVHEFTAELKSMTFSNALGTPVLALVQGLFAWLGYWIFGVQEPLFWGLMTGFFFFRACYRHNGHLAARCHCADDERFHGPGDRYRSVRHLCDRHRRQCVQTYLSKENS